MVVCDVAFSIRAMFNGVGDAVIKKLAALFIRRKAPMDPWEGWKDTVPEAPPPEARYARIHGLIAKGLTDAQVAFALNVEEEAVRVYRDIIGAKARHQERQRQTRVAALLRTPEEQKSRLFRPDAGFDRDRAVRSSQAVQDACNIALFNGDPTSTTSFVSSDTDICSGGGGDFGGGGASGSFD